MTFLLPDLPYAYDALEPYIDARTMEIHHSKHHNAYTNNLNVALDGAGIKADDAEALLKDLNSIPEASRTAVRNNGGGYVNHALFWRIMGPKGSRQPTGDVAAAVNKTFGSFDSFKERFSKAAIARFGSGWAWLSVKQGKLEVTSTANQDNPLSDGATPILALDVWEHAYYLHYQNRRPDYIAAWWQVVNWQAVADLYDAAK